MSERIGKHLYVDEYALNNALEIRNANRIDVYRHFCWRNEIKGNILYAIDPNRAEFKLICIHQWKC